MNLYLIGLPGVGKSTIGKELAKKLQYEFIDLDVYIEQKAMMFVDEIFHLYGEEYFRALETNALKEFEEKNHYVIACGGGIIKNRENKKYMHGFCIYLTSSFDDIEKRLNESVIVRPLLLEKSITQLYFERKDAYQDFADFVIENKDISKTIEQILKKVGLSQ